MYRPTIATAGGLRELSPSAAAGLPRFALIPIRILVVCAAVHRAVDAVGSLGDDLFDVTAGLLDRIPHWRLALAAGGGGVGAVVTACGAHDRAPVSDDCLHRTDGLGDLVAGSGQL